MRSALVLRDHLLHALLELLELVLHQTALQFLVELVTEADSQSLDHLVACSEFFSKAMQLPDAETLRFRFGSFYLICTTYVST